MDRDRLERAWAAGFFDGEGWAAARTRGLTARINQADPDGVPEVLARLRRAVGCGRIAGPKRQEGRIDLYSWSASSRSDVERVYEALAPWLGPAKTAQFAGALGRELACAEPTDEVELRAWAAGFWDGEGSVYLRPHRTHAAYWIGEAAVTQDGVPECSAELARFAQAVRVGKIYGPYRQVWAHQPIFRWKAWTERDARATLHLLFPWIGPVKREQWRAVERVLDEQIDLPRGNPAWGWHKTHCVYGHEYATARLREYRPRGSGSEARRASQQCLACVRAWARDRYRKRKNGGCEEPPFV